jgi:hypothetical protein
VLHSTAAAAPPAPAAVADSAMGDVSRTCSAAPGSPACAPSVRLGLVSSEPNLGYCCRCSCC